MNGPRPSTRAFLSDLSSLPADSKIRFLGCVRHYDISTGRLILEHNYPRSKAGPRSVSVDINAVLGSLSAEELRVGSWLNVLGYVRESTPVSTCSSTIGDYATATTTPINETSTSTMIHRAHPRPVYVEAVTVFSAGAIDLGEYERILRNVQDVEHRVRRPDY